jgi:hypothetical protein
MASRRPKAAPRENPAPPPVVPAPHPAPPPAADCKGRPWLHRCLTPARKAALEAGKDAVVVAAASMGIAVGSAVAGSWAGPSVPTVLYSVGAGLGGILLAEKNPWAGRMLVASGAATGAGVLMHYLMTRLAPANVASTAAGLLAGRGVMPGQKAPVAPAGAPQARPIAVAPRALPGAAIGPAAITPAMIAAAILAGR